MSRAPLLATLALAALGLGTGVVLVRPARAAEAVVVVDRGRAARADAEALDELAVTLVERLRARDLETVLVVYGTRPGGKPRVAVGRADPQEALDRSADREGFAFEEATDPRRALTAALRGLKEDAGLAFLVGPFAGAAEDDEGGRDALARWAEEAAEGVRVFPIRLDEPSAAWIQGARGVLARGTVVVGTGTTAAEVDAWSAFPEHGGAPELEGSVRPELHVLAIGAGSEHPLLRAVADAGDARPAEGGTFRIRRGLSPDRSLVVRFEAEEASDVVWLTAPPEPVRLAWGPPTPAARLLAPADDPEGAAFEALDVRVGAPVETRYRLQRAAVGGPATWRTRERDGDLPSGLEILVAPESTEAAGRVACEVAVRMTAEVATPVDAQGVLVLEAAGVPDRLEIPYRVTVPPGRVTVHLEADDEPTALPPSPGAAPWRVRIERGNENAPDRIHVIVRTDPPSLASALRVRASDVPLAATAAPDGPGLEVAVGATTRLVIGSDDAGIPGDGEVRLEMVPLAGVVADVTGSGRVRARKPRLRVISRAWAYRLDGKRVRGDPPLELEVDPDGGTGSWLVGVLGTPPQVTFDDGGPVAWTLAPTGPGRWRLAADGPWRGERAEVFENRVESSAAIVAWPRGEAPGRIDLEIRVPPRWGMSGWILVGLAAIAVILALVGVSHLRAAPITGTLLYSIRGRPGVVGRLDLAPVGRRAARLGEDDDGRLHLDRGRALVRLRPTRVGGLLEVPAEDPGGRPERHLLVDGLALEVGRHRLRYVSGQPSDTAAPRARGPEEDLLGPEFDLQGGRIAALGTEEATAGFPDPDEEDAPPPRS